MQKFEVTKRQNSDAILTTYEKKMVAKGIAEYKAGKTTEFTKFQKTLKNNVSG